MNKKQLGCVLAAALGLSVAPASAAFITDWTYTATLDWVTVDVPSPVPGDPPLLLAPTFTGGTGGSQQITPNLLSWGDETQEWDVGDTDTWGGTGRSGIGIFGSPALGPIATNGGFVDTTSLVHYNNPISSAFSYLESATLLTTLTLTPTNPAGDALDTIVVAFTTNFIETLNQAPCGFPVATVCDDIFVVDVPDSLTGIFVVDGITYTASIGVAGLGPLPDNTCTTAGRDPGCIGLTTPENAATPVQISFAITAPVAVPEPASVALFGLGLLGLGAVAATRRRRDQE